MVLVRQFLAACTVACSLAEAAFESKEDLPAGAAHVEEKPVAEGEAFKQEEGSGESFTDANREDNTVERISPLNELVLGIGDPPSPVSEGVRPIHVGKGRLLRRQTSQGGGGGFGARKLPVGIPMTAAFEQNPGSPTYSSNRFFGMMHPPHDPPKRGFPRSAIMTLLLMIAIAWLVKQVKTYRRAQANLGLMREDLDQLLSQAERNRTVHKSGAGIDPQLPPKASAAAASAGASGQAYGTEADEDARNAELMSEMQVARARLAELRQLLEEEELRLNQESGGKQGEGQQALPLTRQEALQEIAKLEADALRMQQQRRDLEAVMKLREAIRKEEASLQMSANKVKKLSSSLGDPSALYKTLLDIERAYGRPGNEEDLRQAKALKKRLAEALEDAKKVCVWAPALTEWSLVVEKDQLEEELVITREKGGPPMTSMGAALAKLAEVATVASNSLFNSVSSLWRAMDAVRGREQAPQREESEGDLAALEAERAKREEERLRENLEKLKEEVAAVEAQLLTEIQLTGPLHAQDASFFRTWFAGKKEEARAAAHFVVAGLQSLKAARPLDIHASVDAKRAFGAALESSISKATSALDHVK
ncbi:hypothetical protein Emag_006632 [Eimeria magna]